MRNTSCLAWFFQCVTQEKPQDKNIIFLLFYCFIYYILYYIYNIYIYKVRLQDIICNKKEGVPGVKAVKWSEAVFVVVCFVK